MVQGCFYLLSKIAIATLSLLLINPLQAKQVEYAEMDFEQLVEVDIYAASVLLAHLHKKGDWMFSYGFMSMSMEGNRDGGNDLTAAEVLQQYMVTPIDMTMTMHMLHGMYAPSDDLTWMIMAMQVEKEMTHQTQMGSRFTTRSSGLGDTRISANYAFFREQTDFGENEYGLTFGLSIPTGSIDETDFFPPMGMTVRLPYPMQLGSGTYDFIAGVMYVGISDHSYWGVQGLATFRIGENKNDYTLGNETTVNGWYNYALSDSISGFISLNGKSMDNIDGADPLLNPMMVSTADPNRRAQKSLTLNLGMDLYASEGHLKGNRISIEVGKPIYQDFDGPQLKTEWVFRIGWQVVF